MDDREEDRRDDHRDGRRPAPLQHDPEGEAAVQELFGDRPQDHNT